MTASEIAARRPVWYQLSQLFLDTELDGADLSQMAAILAASPFSVDQLRDIELWEVAPVVSPNLLSVAGEWSGFDEAWVHAECEKRARRRGLLLRLAIPLGFRRFVRRATESYWSRLSGMIESARDNSRTGLAPRC